MTEIRGASAWYSALERKMVTVALAGAMGLVGMAGAVAPQFANAADFAGTRLSREAHREGWRVFHSD